MVKDHSSHLASHLAAAAVLAALTLYRAAVCSSTSPPVSAISTIWTVWTPTLVHYTAYTARDLLDTAGDMVTQLQCTG